MSEACQAACDVAMVSLDPGEQQLSELRRPLRAVYLHRFRVASVTLEGVEGVHVEAGDGLTDFVAVPGDGEQLSGSGSNEPGGDLRQLDCFFVVEFGVHAASPQTLP